MAIQIPIQKGTLLAPHLAVQELLGEGTFGVVVKCLDLLNKESVAVKIVKSGHSYTQMVSKEIKILQQLLTLDSDSCSLVRWFGWFPYQSLICLQFELLDQSLFDFMRKRNFQPLLLAEVRHVLHQMTTALLHLQSLKIIHNDIKPHNIMVVNQNQRPLQVKLIDFGLACHVVDAVSGTNVQSLWYRAPEVVLRMTFSESVDMWSLGLVVFEIAMGFPLLPARHEYDLMKFIVETLGPPSVKQLGCGQRSRYFFDFVEGSQNIWTLKTPKKFASETGHCYVDSRYASFRSLEEAMVSRIWQTGDTDVNKARCFVHLVQSMLRVDQQARAVPLKVLRHPFLTEKPVGPPASEGARDGIIADNCRQTIHQPAGVVYFCTHASCKAPLMHQPTYLVTHQHINPHTNRPTGLPPIHVHPNFTSRTVRCVPIYQQAQVLNYLPR
ncbi:homeodomain-interacting protein kinase 2-like isoform X1 [Synchiropus splendidus]|uniref:homeodomain-interacting protein kinase 2-like isoform X1 n=1 Tax=Synchiropus splendidus TaxID=270530 RepID=UPI00237E9DEF|nr:homeodomain-interacting protein kinase 2-like isoform X1 [Synchiropus splendidus]